MNLVSSWIPALDGVKARLEAGGRVADVGCGHGASTIIMAQAFPKATVTAFDYHPASIEAARRAADKAGVGDRVTFEVAAAKDYPGSGYDLVTFFDCLHDMGDPVAAARHTRKSIATDGVWMIIERVTGGAQAGEARLRAVATEGGFTRIRRATQTPFNLVLEARG
jgi:cyclopropane fatty-acyl-phospholipid synthase-like methyltransferase